MKGRQDSVRTPEGRFGFLLFPSITDMRNQLTSVSSFGPFTLPCLAPPLLNDKGRRWRFRLQDKLLYPHRALWEEANGRALKEGELLRRLCKTKGCCEPTHHRVETQPPTLLDQIMEILNVNKTADMELQFAALFLKASKGLKEVYLPCGSEAVMYKMRAKLNAFRTKRIEKERSPKFTDMMRSVEVCLDKENLAVIMRSAGDDLLAIIKEHGGVTDRLIDEAIMQDWEEDSPSGFGSSEEPPQPFDFSEFRLVEDLEEAKRLAFGRGSSKEPPCSGSSKEPPSPGTEEK